VTHDPGVREEPMSDFIVVVDFPGIKGFVFGTSPAREIRGGSALLELLNVSFLPGFLKEKLSGAYEEVFMGGGAGMFLAHDTNRAQIDEALEQAASAIYRKTGGSIQPVWGVSELDGDRFKEAVSSAHLDLGVAKSHRFKPGTFHGKSLLLECHSCSRPGASRVWTEKGSEEEDPEWLCESCWVKRQNRREGKSWRELVESLELEGHPEEYRPSDFAALGEESRRKGYLTLVYMDGDSMGRIVKSIPDAENFKVFSQTVDKGLRFSVCEAVKAEISRRGG